MPDLDHLRIDGTTYDLRDSTAREKDAVQDNELSSLKSAISDLEEGSLSAVGATNGQLPTADGEGSWSWETPDFIKATDPATGQTFYIPEVKDDQVSETDVWSSNKINSELADKQDETIVDTEGDFTATTVEGALHELHDAIESNVYTAGAGIDISAQNVISIKDRQLVHREITLTEDTKTVTVQFGAKIQEVFVNAVIPNAYDAGYSVVFRALNSSGTELAKHFTDKFTSTGSNNKCFRLKFAMNEFGICEFSSIGATDSEGQDDYAIVKGPARFRVIDPDSPTGISMQLGLGSQSTIKFKTGAKFDCYAILKEGESV